MAPETDTRPRRSALASARAWRALDLAPELRRGVEAAARAAGVEPETWLARAIMDAALAPTAPAAQPSAPATAVPPRDAEAVQALSASLTTARQRGRPEAPPPEPLHLEPAARTEAEDLSAPPPQHRRHLLALLLLALAVAAAAAAGTFYVRYSGAPPASQPAVVVSLPTAPAPQTFPPSPSTPGPAPETAAPQAAAPPPPEPPPAQVAVPPEAPAATPPAPSASGTAPSAEGPPSAATPPAALAPEAAGTPGRRPDTAAAPPAAGPRSQSQQAAVEDYLTGVRYAFGNGVPQDYAKAADYFMRAALQGQADAQYNLGILYDKGLGVPKDPVRAAIWYHSAAEQGHASAQLNLGLAYASGSGVEQNFGEAVRWFRRAAEQGNVTAQYNLAALYANGKGVETSDGFAYAWFSIAAAAGDQEAREQMDAAAKRMTPQQTRDARALAAQILETLKRGGSSAGAPAPVRASPQAGDPPPPPKPADKATVAEIQRYLIKLHYDPGAADGAVGDKTVEAIRQYQIDRRLKVDGEPNKNLLYRLKAEVEKQKK